jgi:methionyl-tRNA formyltransferase
MKIVFFSGNAPNQMALANKIHNDFNLEALIIVQKKKQKINIKTYFDKIFTRLIIPVLSRSWQGMLRFYTCRYNDWPDIPKLNVSDINDQKVIDYLKDIKPDLIVVSGTNLLKEILLIKLNPAIGIINLHTGLSPYVKGGPNCTNWCIANGDFHLIGNSVMWIDKGIDSGNLIATELTEFNQPKNIIEVHIQVMEHAHQLLLKCISGFKKSPENMPNVPQNKIDKGKLYYSKDWTLKQKLKFKKNIKDFLNSYNSFFLKDKRKGVKTLNPSIHV